MSEELIYAATNWRTNGHLILDAYRIGYLKDTDTILDPTYGKGVWWQQWRPQNLVTRSNVEDPSFDFRRTEFSEGQFDAIAYDPPYVSVGGRATSNQKDMYDHYGLLNAPKTPLELQWLINDGLTEMYRIVKPGGIVLVKCQDYISGGKMFLGTHFTLTHAIKLGFLVIDRWEHVGRGRPQPSGRRQVHARRNLSTLFVFKKPLK